MVTVTQAPGVAEAAAAFRRGEITSAEAQARIQEANIRASGFGSADGSGAAKSAAATELAIQQELRRQRAIKARLDKARIAKKEAERQRKLLERADRARKLIKVKSKQLKRGLTRGETERLLVRSLGRGGVSQFREARDIQRGIFKKTGISLETERLRKKIGQRERIKQQKLEAKARKEKAKQETKKTKEDKKKEKKEEKKKDIGEEFFFGRVLGVKPGLGTGFQKDPQFSSGEKFSVRFVNVWAGNKFDKFLRNSKKYKKFSNDIDSKVNNNTLSRFTKDNVLAPIAEDAFTLGATGKFLKSTTAVKNEFLLDEIANLNKQTTREISLGLKKGGKGKGEEVLLGSTKTSNNFKIETLTNYKVRVINGAKVLVQKGKGVTRLINKRTGKQVGKPIEFTFFGKGKTAKGRFIKIGKDGEKLIQGLGKSKAGTGQVQILTKDLKIIRSRFATIFKNLNDVELSLSGRVPQTVATRIKFKDLKIKGFKEKKLSPSLKNLLKRFKTKAKLFGTKKTVKLDINDMAIIRKFAPKSYNKILKSQSTKTSGSGKNIKVNVKTKELGKGFGQVVSKEVENLLSGKVVKGIKRSNSISRIIKRTSGKVISSKKQISQAIVTASATTQARRTEAKKISASKSKQKQSKRSVTSVKSKQVQRQRTKKITRAKLKGKTKKSKPGIKPRIKIPIKPSGRIIIPGLKLKKKKIKKAILRKNGKKSFDVFGKPVKGKRLIKINQKPLSKTDAKNLRNFVVDNSLSRQGSIKPRKGKPQKPKIKVPKGFAKKTTKKFRRVKRVRGRTVRLPKGRVIERRKHSLDTARERKKITLAKLKAQLTKKRTLTPTQRKTMLRNLAKARKKKKVVPKQPKVVKRVATRLKTPKRVNPIRKQAVKKPVNSARRRQLLLNLKKARMAKARKSTGARQQTTARRTQARRVISII